MRRSEPEVLGGWRTSQNEAPIKPEKLLARSGGAKYVAFEAKTSSFLDDERLCLIG